jgi:uncharacterized protein (TIGR00730 family)
MATKDHNSRANKSVIEHKQFTFIAHQASFSWEALRILSELVTGFEFLTNVIRPVTIFGSARLQETDHYYQVAREFARRLAKVGYTVITGGGPGIMEAGNRGAVEGNGPSVGLNIQLPMEQRLNRYVKQGIGFHYFFTRKFMLDYSALAYVYFPAGFGTLDELFTVLTLIQTGKSDSTVPIILIGVEFWQPLADWIKGTIRARGLVGDKDLTFLHITDDLDEALSLIRDAGDRIEGGG